MVTTQEAGLLLTQEQWQKLQILSDLRLVDIAELIDVNQYSADRAEAYLQFCNRFRFFQQVTTLADLEKIRTRWIEFMDFCVPPVLLLDPSRYDSNLDIARKQFEERLALFDCYKGVLGCFGKARVGKSGYVSVHSWKGKEYFDRPVIAYKFKLTPAFGNFTYLNDETLLDEIDAVTTVVEKANGEELLKWRNQEVMQEKTHLFVGSQIVIEEADKVFPRGSFTRLGRLLYHMIKEWGHYKCLFALITQDPEDLNKHVVKRLTHEIWVSRSTTMSQTSDVRIRHIETGEKKPIIHLYRPRWHSLWMHDAPIAIETNVSRRELDRRARVRQARLEEAEL